MNARSETGSRSIAVAAGLAMLALSGAAWLAEAANEAAPPVAAPADATVPAEPPHDAPAPAAAPAAPPAPARPIAALLTPNAERGMLLGIARAGSGYVAVGGNGVIVRSADGKSWTQVASPVDTALNAVAFADAQHGWAVGHDAVILKTEDGGSTWKIQNFQPDLYTPLFAVVAISPDVAIAVGAFGTIKATADGGAHWANVDAPAISEEKLHLNAIARLGSGRLAVAGEHGMVGVSADGIHWTRVPNPYEGSFFGILPSGPNGATVFGMRGNLFVTSDIGAVVWEKRDTGTTDSLFGGEAAAGEQILLTGAEGTVLVMGGDGKVSAMKGIEPGASKGSLTASLSATDALILVGEEGVTVLPRH